MSELQNETAVTEVENKDLIPAILELLLNQTKMPVTCLPKQSNKLPYEKDLKNPERMGRYTYACLSMLLIDNTSRSLVGLETIELTPEIRNEIKRVMRASEFLIVNGSGIVRKKNPQDLKNEKSAAKPQSHKQNAKPNSKPNPGTAQLRAVDLSEAATREVRSKTPASTQKKHQSRDKQVQHQKTDSMTYRIIGELHKTIRGDAEQGALVKKHEYGCRHPEQMIPETAELLLKIKRNLRGHTPHSLETELLIGGITELISKCPWELTQDGDALVTVEEPEITPTAEHVSEAVGQESSEEPAAEQACGRGQSPFFAHIDELAMVETSPES